MTFTDDMKNFQAKVRANSQSIFVNVASAAKDSIADGSPLTGAPGQPVDTGALRASWILAFPSPAAAEISTKIGYAPIIEDNERGVTFKNHGPHSVKLTIANLDRIVEAETAKVVGNG